MSNLVTVRRVTIVTDAMLEKSLLEQIVRLGAKGYSCTDCRGRGEHEVFADPFTGATRVRIDTIVQPAVAAAIMDYLHTPALMNQPLTACVETVEVSPLDKF
ncbi:MAG TPA: hypothetical protein VL475_04490 [Planctomycetaceae bacterium]|nr:hypothetical protein [Planctomycetaceae bacterium]